MITIIDEPKELTKVKVAHLQLGDTFVYESNQLYIVGDTRANHFVSCTRLGGKESGKSTQMGINTLVLQVNVKLAITRL